MNRDNLVKNFLTQEQQAAFDELLKRYLPSPNSPKVFPPRVRTDIEKRAIAAFHNELERPPYVPAPWYKRFWKYRILQNRLLFRKQKFQLHIFWNWVASPKNGPRVFEIQLFKRAPNSFSHFYRVWRWEKRGKRIEGRPLRTPIAYSLPTAKVLLITKDNK
jgi:hypothetical protein